VNLTKKGIVVITTFIIVTQSLAEEKHKESTQDQVLKKAVGMGLCVGLCYCTYHYLASIFSFLNPTLRQAQRNEQAIGEVKAQVIVLEGKVDILHSDVKDTVIPAIATLDSKADVLQKKVDTLQTTVAKEVIEPLTTLQIQSTLTLQKLDAQSAEIKTVAASLRDNTTAICAVGMQLGDATKKIDTLQTQASKNLNQLCFIALQAQNHNTEMKGTLNQIVSALQQQQTLFVAQLPRGPGAQQPPLSIVYPSDK